ncbi:glycoside hydrolase [Stereum hirsutum FP-91666 SS1]|uniref:glycoside hydrolase n=1 Tax=Stereum hirsutum (strain FP-91666) TaxID=721885 RepID=UPI000440F30E|nr:glycoside hydrolase [Stereum hirsutum FP-91666 SS1]EIM89284.1 glycoside hydrolase [Stereum hirsutum FP-91666 SS1]
MFSFQHHLDNAKTLTSIILANETGSSETTGVISIHMFSMTLVAVDTDATTECGPVLNVQNVRSTTKFRTLNETQVQLMEITLNNFAPSTADPSSWITKPTTFTLSSSSIRTVLPGTVQRLRGGDQVRVIVGVLNTNNVTAGTLVDDVVVLVDGKQVGGKWSVTAGIPDYVEGDESLMTHESPEWFDGAKFGLFVHWGIYSVPSWTVSGTQYAEWYWYWQHNPANSSSAVWTHHKEVYGEDFLYDDFFPNFTASAFDAKEFVKFVADIGAKYYVLTTKHHDGFALFDTGNSSNRNSLNYGPQRDLVAEIVAAAKETQPQLHNGLYFSLPEWFNPSNAYNWSAPLELYTGYVEVDDFLVDIMKPQMEALFYNYDADILWCDVGGPTIFQEIAPAWFNTAKEAGRQVTYNARCGANYSDFDVRAISIPGSYCIDADRTLNTQLRKWESSEGSDPYSYGFNQDTPWSNYQNSSYILHSLIDIVSKNGNYLIDIGPMANVGTIVEPSVTSLLEVGQWLQIAGDAIYDTQYWFVAAEDDASDLRFTTKSDAFYIISLEYPTNGTIRTSLPLPVKNGDIVTFLGNTTTTTTSSNSTTITGRGEEKAGVEWHWTDEGVFELFVDEEALKKVANAWAFKIEYKW